MLFRSSIAAIDLSLRQMATERDTLRAENTRLRTALEDIASWGEGETVSACFDEPASAAKARAALATPEHQG